MSDFNAVIDTLRMRYDGVNGTIIRCKRRWEQAVKAASRAGGNHFYYGFRYYHDQTLGKKPNHSVAVIRTENLWQDVVDLDLALGGSGVVKGGGTKYTHGSEAYAPQKKNLSARNRIYLCCLIHEEIAAYQTLVLEAFNLNSSQKKESLTNLLANCHVDEILSVQRVPFEWHELYNRTDSCKTLEEGES